MDDLFASIIVVLIIINAIRKTVGTVEFLVQIMKLLRKGIAFLGRMLHVNVESLEKKRAQWEARIEQARMERSQIAKEVVKENSVRKESPRNRVQTEKREESTVPTVKIAERKQQEFTELQQAVVWAEILGAPKARRMRRF